MSRKRITERVSVLVTLLRSGNQTQKADDVRALAILDATTCSKQDSWIADDRKGLSRLWLSFSVGSRIQKPFAAATLGYIGGASKDKGSAIRRTGQSEGHRRRRCRLHSDLAGSLRNAHAEEVSSDSVRTTNQNKREQGIDRHWLKPSLFLLVCCKPNKRAKRRTLCQLES